MVGQPLKIESENRGDSSKHDGLFEFHATFPGSSEPPEEFQVHDFPTFPAGYLLEQSPNLLLQLITLDRSTDNRPSSVISLFGGSSRPRSKVPACRQMTF